MSSSDRVNAALGRQAAEQARRDHIAAVRGAEAKADAERQRKAEQAERRRQQAAARKASR